MQRSNSQNSRQNKSSDAKTIITITVKLLVIGVVTAALLAVVNGLTKDKIAENIAKTKQESIARMFEGELDIQLYDGTFEGVNEISCVHSDGKHLGYVAEVAPKGFGGEIILMVGVDNEGKVVGVDVIDQGETPGIGTRIKDDATFVQRFKGADGTTVASVDLLSGATISSKAVRAGVQTALSVYGQVVCGGAQ